MDSWDVWERRAGPKDRTALVDVLPASALPSFTVGSFREIPHTSAETSLFSLQITALVTNAHITDQETEAWESDFSKVSWLVRSQTAPGPCSPGSQPLYIQSQVGESEDHERGGSVTFLCLESKIKNWQLM